MTRSSCFVPGCKTGYSTERKKNEAAGIKNPSMFCPPKDPYMFQRWCKRIGRKDRKLTHKDPICALHFLPECIERYYETKFPDGHIDRLERGKVRLKPDAEPTVFSNLPEYLPSRASSPDDDSLDTLSNVITHFSSYIDVEQHNVSLQSTFDSLVSKLGTLALPSDNWTYSILRSRNVIFIFEVNESLCVMKLVKISHDLQVQVILNNEVSVPLNKFKQINDVDDLIALLDIVHRNIEIYDTADLSERI